MLLIVLDSVLFFEADGKTNRFPFYYTNQLDSIGSASNLAKRTRRLAQELVTLQTALPLTLGSSVFIRASEERLDAMKVCESANSTVSRHSFQVLITGPASTPYSNGCFEFDVYFPKNYPECPMHVNMITTGHGSVRFNPNLYNVCWLKSIVSHIRLGRESVPFAPEHLERPT